MFNVSSTSVDCGELRIENGQTCYTKLNVSGKQRWEAIIKCLEGFELWGISTRKCTRDRSSVFTWDDRKIKCIQGNSVAVSQCISIFQ